MLRGPDQDLLHPNLSPCLSNFTLYKWQEECISLGISAPNLVFSAPTSAGKSLVAEVLLVNSILRTGLKGIFVLPYVSIVVEKLKYLTALFGPKTATNLRIGGMYSQVSISIDDVDLVICTIEKANGLINKLIEEDKVDIISCIVVDELHMLGTESRGYLLELMLTKLMIVHPDISIVGMSATLPNLKDLANWLQARLYVTNYRPVELVEYIKVQDVIYDTKGIPVRKLQADQKVAIKMGDPDFLIPIVFEVISAGHSCLVFCSTKRECENACKNLSRLMQTDNTYLPQELVEQRNVLVQELNQSPSGLDPVLAVSIRNGFGYHHSGLLVEERWLLEDAFRNGVLNCICATSTLASGVNLPARRVIFRSPYISRNFLCSKEYKQMSGRAGRRGLDDQGESIIMCEQKDFEKCKTLVMAKHKPLESCLGEEECLKRAILEVVASRIVKSPDDLAAYIQKTLLYHHSTVSRERAMNSALDIIQFLILNDFIDFKNGEYVPFRLANATLASSLSPGEALCVSKELYRDVSKFCLLDDFHIIYHCTPAFFNQINHKWERMSDIYGVLQGSYQAVAQVVGISGGYLQKLSMGGRAVTDDDRYLTHVRFFNALVIDDLISEVPINKLIEKYDMGNSGRGSIQSLQTLASSYCGMVRIFCERMGLKNLSVLVGLNQDRLAFGVEAEIISLAKIPGFDRAKARLLYNAGFKTPLSISKAGTQELFLVLKSDGLELPDNFYKKSAGKLLLSAQAYLEF